MTVLRGEAWGNIPALFTASLITIAPTMGMKNWPHPPGTCRALAWTQGRSSSAIPAGATPPCRRSICRSAPARSSDRRLGRQRGQGWL